MRSLFRVLCCLFLCSYGVPSAHAETITVVADLWCPYNCEEKAEKQGYMLEIARAALLQHGITIEYKVMPWSRALELTRKGEFHAIIGAAASDAPGFIYPKTPQGLAQMCFWTKGDAHWTFSGLSSLEHVTLGAITDYSYSSTGVDQYIQDHHRNTDRVQLVGGDNAMELNLRKLAVGRIDVMLEDKNVIEHHFVTKGQAFPLREAGALWKDEPIEENYLYLAFSPNKPNSARYAALLDEGILEMRRTGALQRILANYHITDWEQAK